MLSGLLDSWASIYANHAALKTVIGFAHIGGLVAAGGCAITADLATITAAREGAAARALHLDMLKRTHRLVVIGLVTLTASGLLLLGADFDTFLHSKMFWLKMGLLGLLIANGSVLLIVERQANRGEPRAWGRLHKTALASLVLWFVTTLAGAALPNIG